MNHPSDDQLLKHALELLDGHEQSEVHDHLAECDSCRSRLSELQQDVSRLSSLRLGAPADYPLLLPHSTSQIPRSWLRMAAVLVLGFAGGILAGRLSRQEPITVTPMMSLHVSRVQETASPPCDALQTILR